MRRLAASRPKSPNTVLRRVVGLEIASHAADVGGPEIVAMKTEPSPATLTSRACDRKSPPSSNRTRDEKRRKSPQRKLADAYTTDTYRKLHEDSAS